MPLGVEESDKVAKAVVSNSRKRYATSKATVEKQMEKMFDVGQTEKKIAKDKQAEPKVAAQAKMHDV